MSRNDPIDSKEHARNANPQIIVVTMDGGGGGDGRPADNDGTISNNYPMVVVRPIETVTVVIDDEPAPMRPITLRSPRGASTIPVTTAHDERLMAMDMTTLPVAQAELIPVIPSDRLGNVSGSNSSEIPFVQATSLSEHSPYNASNGMSSWNSTSIAVATGTAQPPSVAMVTGAPQAPSSITPGAATFVAWPPGPSSLPPHDDARIREHHHPRRRHRYRDENGSLTCCGITTVVGTSICVCIIVPVMVMVLLWAVTQGSTNIGQNNTDCGIFLDPCEDNDNVDRDNYNGG